MANVSRWDRSSFEASKVTKTDEGYLRTDASLTRAGILVYTLPDGSIQREFRSPEEVFNADSLETLKQIPVTMKHPPEGRVNSKNSRIHQKGSTGDTIKQDGDLVNGSVMATSHDLVEAIENKEMCEVSCGYKCDVDQQPGTWRGQPYDAVQKNIRYNHVAIVPRGRAGREVRLHIDAEAAEMIVDETEQTKADEMTLEEAVKQIKELSATVKESTDALKLVKTDAEKTAGELAAIKSAHAALLKQHNDSEAAAPKAVAARVALEKKAEAILGASVDLSTKTDAEVKAAVVKHVQPEMKLDGVSEGFIEGAYSVALTVHAEKAKALDERKAGLTIVHDKTKTDAERTDAEKAKAKMVEENRTAWQPKATA